MFRKVNKIDIIYFVVEDNFWERFYLNLVSFSNYVNDLNFEIENDNS